MAEVANDQGTRGGPVPRRWRHRAAVALVLSPLLAAALPVGTATAAHGTAPESAPGAEPTGSRSAEIALTGVGPLAPGEDDTLTVSGTVTNRSGSAITDAEVGLRTGPRLTTRSAINGVTADQPYAAGSDGVPVTGDDATTPLADLAPGATRSFTLDVPVADLRLGDSGVYQLGVTLAGRPAGTSSEQILGIERTPVPWQKSPAETRTKITALWPLISSPHLTARTDSDEQQTPVFRNEDLVDEISPGGRLHQLVAAGAELPVTWLVDPDLLASVHAMTQPYQVETPDGPVAGTGQQVANQWLHDLQDAVEDEEVVALPFADPDVASLAHQGRDVSGALGHLQPATEVSAYTVKSILHTTPSTDYAWPVEGAIDPAVVSVATSAGARHVITRSDSLRETRGLTYTPNAARPIGGGITAVSADATLSTLFTGDMTRADTATRAVRQFLAHTLSITEQNPTEQRHVLLAPQRMPTTSQARAMAEALTVLTEGGGWAELSPLSETAKAEPDPRANRQVPGADAYPDTLRSQELPTAAFEAMRSTQTTLKDFAVILSQEDRVVTPFGNAIRREMSTSWRGRTVEAAAYRAAVQQYLVSLTDEVRLVDKSPMTLSGRSATIPVTVKNDLVQQVDGLELRLTSGRRIGLDIDDDTKRVVVEGGHSQSITFDTTAKANGRTYLTAQLYTEDDKPYGEPMTFQVDVTEITSTVLLVIAGGVLLVVLAGVRMYTQRKRRGPQPDPEAPLAAPDAPGAGEAPEAEGTADERDAGAAREADAAGEAGECSAADETGRAGEADQAGQADGDRGKQPRTGDGTGSRHATADESGPGAGSTRADGPQADGADGAADGPEATPGGRAAPAEGGDARDTRPESRESPGPGEKVDR
ncbi:MULTISPECIES: DUF6049 family protein [Streptomyces]|uniref:DUF6049 family protein n=1 Tax=Streptomyces TaxID=1883 RepID=UPI002248BA22|nr:DUF6049 family protein [Streptomyces sp. JHD 1]MCX2967960.1 DUF6049 family protein [Streptomyces sp. JHD 1]